MERKLSTIFASDVVGFSKMMGKNERHKNKKKRGRNKKQKTVSKMDKRGPKGGPWGPFGVWRCVNSPQVHECFGPPLQLAFLLLDFLIPQKPPAWGLHSLKGRGVVQARRAGQDFHTSVSRCPGLVSRCTSEHA